MSLKAALWFQENMHLRSVLCTVGSNEYIMITNKRTAELSWILVLLGFSRNPHIWPVIPSTTGSELSAAEGLLEICCSSYMSLYNCHIYTARIIQSEVLIQAHNLGQDIVRWCVSSVRSNLLLAAAVARREVPFVALAAAKWHPFVCRSEDRLITLGITNINFTIVILSTNHSK